MSIAELELDGVEVLLGQGAEVESSGQLLAQKGLGVLVAAALGRRFRVTAVDLDSHSRIAAQGVASYRGWISRLFSAGYRAELVWLAAGCAN